MTLIEKIAAAQKPDRELDAEIAVWIYRWLGAAGRPAEPGDNVAPGHWWAKFPLGESLRNSPTYTFDTEAAFTLVPAGIAALDHLCEHWRVDAAGLTKTGGATCKLVRAIDGKPVKFKAEGATLPFAIIGAALKLFEAAR